MKDEAFYVGSYNRYINLLDEMINRVQNSTDDEFMIKLYSTFPYEEKIESIKMNPKSIKRIEKPTQEMLDLVELLKV
jgi:hypothetical protein